MGWDHEIAKKLKEARKLDGQALYLTGTVVSGGASLTLSIYDGQAFLGPDQLELLAGAGELPEGARVALLPGPRFLHGGQKFLVLGVVTDAV